MISKLPAPNPEGAMKVYKEYCRVQIEIGNGSKKSRLIIDGKRVTYQEAYKVLNKKQLDLSRLQLY